MIDFKEVPFSEEAKEKIKTSVINYKRFAGVEISISKYRKIEWHFEVEISQTSTPTGKVLTAEELVKRAQDVFEGITPEGLSPLIIVRPYMP